MKKLILSLAVIVVILGAAYFYFTRPASAPSVENEEVLNPSLSEEGVSIYRISSENSITEFRIKEVLNGKNFTAVGTTTAIAGEFKIVQENGVRTAEFGDIKINARTFKTDDARRDGAIARLILKSEDPANEFIVLKPVNVTGLPDSLEYGVLYTFKIIGDLTISGITKRQTFDVKATLEEDKITGEVMGTLKRSDYKLVIPNIPFVANVSDTFEIKANITANKVN